jgi:drug/metabolite transporter (DMT)-like permease
VLRRPADQQQGLGRGWLTNVVGNGVQATALQMGSVSAVQPLMSTQLLFAMSFASVEQRRWPSPSDIASAIAVCAGLVMLLTTEGATPHSAPPHRGRALAMAACAIVVITVLRLISRSVAATLASVLSGASAGLCHAMSAVLIKVIIEDVSSHGVARAVVHWPLYALIASTAGGFVLGQLAVASGPPCGGRRDERDQSGRQLSNRHARLRRADAEGSRRGGRHRFVGRADRRGHHRAGQRRRNS